MLSAFLLFCIETKAQEAGTHSTIPDKNNTKGRREIRKDERIKRHTEHEEKQNGEKLEAQSNKPFHKEKTHKTSKQPEREGEIIKK